MSDSKFGNPIADAKTEFRAPEEEWEDYKKKFQKTYGSEDEEKRRFEIFKQNLNEIVTHNKKYVNGEVTWYKGINQFSDMTQEEFAKTHLFPEA